jgi:hypothetical protein
VKSGRYPGGGGGAPRRIPRILGGPARRLA